MYQPLSLPCNYDLIFYDLYFKVSIVFDMEAKTFEQKATAYSPSPPKAKFAHSMQTFILTASYLMVKRCPPLKICNKMSINRKYQSLEAIVGD